MIATSLLLAGGNDSSRAITTMINKGTGAGGKNTNLYGKKFEDKTDNTANLLADGFDMCRYSKKKYDYYLHKKDSTTGINLTHLLQGGLKAYIKRYHGIDLFRHPDEAYIIDDGVKKIIKNVFT